LRNFKDGNLKITSNFIAAIFRSKDLVVDVGAFDGIQHAGGFISVSHPSNTIDANTIQ
jgi:hypothetical protein